MNQQSGVVSVSTIILSSIPVLNDCHYSGVHSLGNVSCAFNQNFCSALVYIVYISRSMCNKVVMCLLGIELTLLHLVQQF